MDKTQEIEILHSVACQYDMLQGTNGWNGLGVNTCEMGGSEHNTLCAGAQFLFALTLSKHPKTKVILESSKKVIPMQDLANAQVLNGLKIMDLGCGYKPSFARLSRWLGAEVYTVDIIPAKSLVFEPRFWNYFKC